MVEQANPFFGWAVNEPQPACFRFFFDENFSQRHPFFSGEPGPRAVKIKFKFSQNRGQIGVVPGLAGKRNFEFIGSVGLIA